jgi:beta-galactosidase
MHAAGIRYVRIGEFAWSRIEPRRGSFDWAWLDRAIDVLSAAGLQIILGTPTACPPKWLVDEYPDILAADADGNVRGFGSRRHYCFSSDRYRQESRRIVAALADRYATHPGIRAWQIDNEYGCHDTVLSYSVAARDAFRGWLSARYADIDSLNTAWGNVFWSMEYGGFDEIELPNRTVTEASPAHWLDFRRFSSDQVVAFNREQVEVLLNAGVEADLVHNYMGFSTDFDHFDLGVELDVASWDSYPLGFLEQSRQDPARKAHYRQQGDPDFAAFHHDLYRAVGQGRWWVMEQQPGPVNWAPANAVPLRGMLRLWAFEAFAHGAELVSFFRWRQAPFGQEQYHAGLLLPDGNEAPGLAEVRQVAEELERLDWEPAETAPVALVLSYEARWITDIQPQAEAYSMPDELLEWYRAVRRLGVDVDVVSPDAELSDYRVVLIPCLPVVPTSLVERVAASDAIAVFGPRTGSKTADFQVPATLPPGPLQQLIALRMVCVDSLSLGLQIPMQDCGDDEYVHTWLEHTDTELEPLATTANGIGAWFADGRVHYLSACVSPALLGKVMRSVLEQGGVHAQDMPAGVRLRRRGRLTFAFNYASERRPVPCGERELLLGHRVLEPGEVAAWRT